MGDDGTLDLAALARRQPLIFSDSELAELLARAETSAGARKLLSAHFAETGEVEQAFAHARAGFALDREPEAAANIMRLYYQVERFDEALAFAEAENAWFDPIELALFLTMIHWREGRDELSRQFGREALEQKAAIARSVTARPATPVRREGAKILSFSLFGDAPQYLEGALRNAVVARHLYPGWRARFYVDATVPVVAIDRLSAEGAEIIVIAEDDPLAGFGRLWRFLVEDDPSVSLYAVRDCDAVINIKERTAVEDWLNSGKTAHIMRDHPVHAELILAGMWGARAGALGSMRNRILEFLKAHPADHWDTHLDQQFLRNEVWPVIHRDALTHDDWFAFGDCQPFRQELNLPPFRHIGQDDSVIRASDL